MEIKINVEEFLKSGLKQTEGEVKLYKELLESYNTFPFDQEALVDVFRDKPDYYGRAIEDYSSYLITN